MTWADIYIAYFWLSMAVALLLLFPMIYFVWGWHLGPLPPKPESHFGTDLGPEVTCRCRRHDRKTPKHDRVCGLKKLLSESHWRINLWLIQIGGPYCAYCFHGH